MSERSALYAVGVHDVACVCAGGSVARATAWPHPRGLGRRGSFCATPHGLNSVPRLAGQLDRRWKCGALGAPAVALGKRLSNTQGRLLWPPRPSSLRTLAVAALAQRLIGAGAWAADSVGGEMWREAV